jgi:hypothetical protein
MSLLNVLLSIRVLSQRVEFRLRSKRALASATSVPLLQSPQFTPGFVMRAAGIVPELLAERCLFLLLFSLEDCFWPCVHADGGSNVMVVGPLDYLLG